jgi:hypothetical protein
MMRFIRANLSQTRSKFLTSQNLANPQKKSGKIGENAENAPQASANMILSSRFIKG